ncbi:MAG: UvrD-helicase domain-containing protein [Chromatiales bacterium]|nr:UvrD-helicase domain-containing protein [Chromatiales bacterium]
MGSSPNTDAAGREPPADSPDREAREPAVDPRARELLAAWEDRAGDIDFALAARRLEGAMHDIDRANVFTIHGFCQRVLADLAFESGLSFGCEVGGEGGEAVAAAVRDFWRRRMYPSSTLLMRHAVENGFLPRSLADWVSHRRAKIGAEVVGGDPPAQPLETCEATWGGVFDAVRSQWESQRDTFRTEILEGPWLNRQRYRTARSKADLDALNALFCAAEPRLPAEGAAGRYGREQLSHACKRGFEVPDNPLFDALDRLDEASEALRAVYDQWLRWARREALAEVRQSVRRRIRTDRVLAWDDLLIELDHALGSAGGERLAARIRREFPCALIDEYQDTDPVQARIFSRIYAGSARSPRAAATSGPENEGGSDRGDRTRPGPFIVVGDPKQSIYRFRGADVFAYLAARRSATGRLHLDRNWRSVPPLVEAVNAVFSGAAPFVTAGIGYRAVAAAGEPPGPLRLAGEGAPVPLEFRLLPRVRDGKPLAKKDVLPVVAGAAAEEIARLLELAGRGEAAVDDRPLAGADLAVLVRTREQGRVMAEALRERGVRSVEIDDGSVFHTREAEQLERLLWALADPGREPRVRGALAGDLFGLDARALRALGDDERAWSAWAQRREDWRSHWTSRGIGSVLLRLLEGEGGAKHLLRQPDGVRRLTNYRHLAELLQAAETRDRLAASELAAWLNRRRADPDSRDEEAKLRIESDERLVRILTVHGSKGLEFPVVFCPFAWDTRGPGRRSDAVDAVYHRGAADGYREVIDLAPRERAVAIEWLEEFAESVRLFYVALTRAKYRCVVSWGQVRGAEDSPLAWLLHRSAHGQPPATEPDGDDAAIAALRAVADRFRGLGAEAWRDEVEAFARRLPGAVTVSVLDPEPPPARPPERLDDLPPALAARELRRALRRIRSLTSFSALWAEAAMPAGGTGDRASGGGGAPGGGRAGPGQPAGPGGGAGAPAGGGGAVVGERTAFTFPRGPVAGSCLHRIFERLDDPPEIAADRTDLDEICVAALADFGIDGVWQPVARDMVENTRAVLLRSSEAAKGAAKGSEGGAGSGRDVVTAGREAGRAAGNGGFRLGDPHRRLVELEFHFPVEGLDRRRLASRLVEHGYPDPFAGAATNGTGGSRPPLHGFLRGYVDLVVEHGQRWYVVDYKSNWLGPEPSDYVPEALAASMRAGGYTLQYLVYLVALHRYLATRLPDYDCERHVGGAFYLFVRGIDPAAGMRRGVYFDRPTAECLLALDGCFRGGGA